METFESIARRVSVREYSSKAVPKALIEKLVDAGRRAPTARAVEPWEFVVVSDKKALEKLAGLAENGRFIKGSSCAIAVFCKETKYYLEDGSAATENILLAAADLGLGACWVAGDKKPYADDVARLLKAPAGTRLISILPIGWPASEARQAKNRPLEEVIHWERF